MRFIEFLIENVNVTLDPEDPAGSIATAKDQVKQSMRDPVIAAKQRQRNLKDRKADIAQEEDPEIKKGRETIRRDEERVAKQRMELEKEKARKEAERARAAGFATGEIK